MACTFETSQRTTSTRENSDANDCKVLHPGALPSSQLGGRVSFLLLVWGVWKEAAVTEYVLGASNTSPQLILTTVLQVASHFRDEKTKIRRVEVAF